MEISISGTWMPLDISDAKGKKPKKKKREKEKDIKS